MEPITRPEAIAALNATVEPGDSASYFITPAPAEQRGDTTVYWVGSSSEDGIDADGDPTGFTREASGAVILTGPEY